MHICFQAVAVRSPADVDGWRQLGVDIFNVLDRELF